MSKQTPWYVNWFSSKLYLELYKHRNEDDARNLINLVQRVLPLKKCDKVLDVCCGAGRYSIELARRGFEVTGFDLSKFLISEAKKNFKALPEKYIKAKFLNKDMRKFDFNHSFDLAANLFTSFGYFSEDEENFLVIKNVSASLKKNGYFVFDFLNGNYLRKNIVPYDKKIFLGKEFTSKRTITGDFVRKEITVKSGTKKINYEEVLKLYKIETLKKVFNDNRLKVIYSFGDYYGNKYNKDKSQRLILIAQKF
ncbi:MAG: class I SAM-dependent methyltransferase [Bacteroidetes bacterium]|nr:class I SAM-dependent methyltransferase [Bacteroidota bacterium]